MRDLDRDVTNILQPFQGSFDPNANQGIAGTLLTNHLSMRRNKRCLLAYHKTRTDKLEDLVWRGADVVDLSGQQLRDGAGGANAPSAAGRPGDGGTSSLSPQEEDYVRQYGDLLAAYKGQWTDIDLTGSLDPPRDLFIDVRVLKDAGEIQTEYGYVELCHAMLSSRGKMLIFVCVCVFVCVQQGHYFDKEQSVLRKTGRRRAIDRPGISAEAELDDKKQNSLGNLTRCFPLAASEES